MDTKEGALAAQATRALLPYQQLAAQEFADRLGVRRRKAGAPVRTIFVSDQRVERPPLARLLSGTERGGGGRGGQLRAKLYLSLLWICAKQPYDVARPARAWAALLGLPEHETRGVRRVHQAFKDLEERGFVTVEDRIGFPSRVTLLSDSGDRTPFRPAPDTYSQQQRLNASDDVLRLHQYFRVPSTLWTSGQIGHLKGPGLAMLLALLSEQRGSTAGVWISPERARERFSLATSTRREGLDQLRALDLITTSAKVVSEQGAYIDWARLRNVHQVVGL